MNEIIVENLKFLDNLFFEKVLILTLFTFIFSFLLYMLFRFLINFKINGIIIMIFGLNSILLGFSSLVSASTLFNLENASSDQAKYLFISRYVVNDAIKKEIGDDFELLNTAHNEKTRIHYNEESEKFENTYTYMSPEKQEFISYDISVDLDGTATITLVEDNDEER